MAFGRIVKPTNCLNNPKNGLCSADWVFKPCTGKPGKCLYYSELSSPSWNDTKETRPKYVTAILSPVRNISEDRLMVNQLIQKEHRPYNIQKAATNTTTPDSLEDSLLTLLQELNYEKGLRLFKGLKAEYSGLDTMLKSRLSGQSLIDMPKTIKLVDETYFKALSFLQTATNIYRQLDLTNETTLKAENLELESSMKDKADTSSIVYKTIEDAYKKNCGLMVLVKRTKERLDELFGQISLCKDAITEIRLSLPDLVNHQSQDEVSAILLELRSRLDFAQRLNEEYKARGL